MLRQLADKLPGTFLVLDGPDGAGKTSRLDQLEAELTGAGAAVVRAVDPGGTAIGDKIRHILLEGKDLEAMDARCEALLFMASRAQLVAQVVRPALAAGKIVLCDRFISATMAYQGAVGIDPEQIRRLGEFAVGQTWPDLTVVLDVPAEIGLERAGRLARTSPASEPDAMERRSIEFHQRVAETFRQLPKLYPTPVVLVDAGGDEQQVHQALIEAIVHATV